MTLTADAATAREGLVEVDGQGFYLIPDFDRIPPFLMSVVSDGDRWMFVSSAGPLTAGRMNSGRALFPYETDDRIHNAAGRVGPVTAIRIEGSEPSVWRPFHGPSESHTHRSLYKSVVGDSVIFEETHLDRHLTFRYRWTTNDQLGFIRTVTLSNDGTEPVRVRYVDGMLNVLPYGLDPAVYQRLSSLTNAYKRSEVIDPARRLAIFSLESGITDRPEPAEVLRATSVWSVGPEADVTVIPDAIADLSSGQDVRPASKSTGRPGAYLLHGSLDVAPGDAATWHIVADVAQDQAAVVALQARLVAEPDVLGFVTDAIEQSGHRLVELMAPADALQRTGDRVATAHQFANVTYNVMRGGVPIDGYRVSSRDFAAFVTDRNREVADRHRNWLSSLPVSIDRAALIAHARDQGDPQLRRLTREYLPFGFARRHGDPSRPWNSFSIRVRDTEGEPILYYEGNWRDIFQNWEALCASFPEFLEGVITVFVDASTPDGYNPYRITRSGIDWEVPDPDDPWSGIGYWGDHQIVYLLRLLEASERFHPGRLAGSLSERLFSYANVPYRIAPYEALVRNPKSTIHYDEAAAAASLERAGRLGGDGRLVADEAGEVYLVTLAEKLLVPVLAKLSNYVPGGGIWLNTERPEWNDANNALVGYGLSMVTLYQLRRYLDHLRRLVRSADVERVPMSTEVTQWLAGVTAALAGTSPQNAISDRERKALMDALGTAFSDYRARVYASGFSGLTEVAVEDVAALCDLAIEHLDATIRVNRRPDGLYHSYNLVRFESDGASAAVEHLFEMLEGQVAILDSGVLSAAERADVIDALFSSAMYRADQDSFILYPARRLPSFLEKNVVPSSDVADNPLLSTLLAQAELSIITVDANGEHRFDADFTNRGDLIAALDRLASDDAWRDLVAAHREATLDTYERVFGHHGYTGRSGSMYGYEGIGSIYWHMVAKLLVAVQGSVLDAQTEGASDVTLERLIDAYWRVRSGLGFNKSAADFGAMPLDPYSHTPAHAGAQQPGMTGLVKEELLTRPLEVGVRVEEGSIHFDPVLLRSVELLDQPETWQVYDVEMQERAITVDAGSLGMTVCQVPVIVSSGIGDPEVEVRFSDGTSKRFEGNALDEATSAEVFARSGAVELIEARVRID